MSNTQPPTSRRSFIAYDGTVTARWTAGWNRPDHPDLAGALTITRRLNPHRHITVAELTEAEHAAVHRDITRPITLPGR